MNKVKQEILSFIKKHHLLTEDTTILLGVSGGPDSMALLHFFHSIQNEWNLNLIVLSADHQLRGEEGKRDLEYVKQQCKERDIQFIGTSLNVQAYKRKNNAGTQLAARELRYQFFAEQMVEQHADYLALGHHGDDQIETMLMEMVRIADSSSFSGIPVQRPFVQGSIIRPLLCVTKQDIEEYCEKHSLSPKIDPSNKETTYTRNYYRKHVVPKLKGKNRNLHVTIQRLSETLKDDEMFLRHEAKNMVNHVMTFYENEKKLSFSIESFKSYPTALQRRAYHLILNYLYDKLPKNLSYLHEENFFKILDGEGNIEIDFPYHLKVQKSYQRVTLFFRKSDPKDASFHYLLNIPEVVNLPHDLTLSVYYTKKWEEESMNSLIIPMESVALPLHIRTRQPGDRMSWKGLNGSKKIKDVFIDEKIPIDERDSWPIVTDHDGTILWLIGLRKKQFEQKNNGSLMIKITYK